MLMESGTFAVDPEPSGPPWRRWEEIDPDGVATRGIYAAVYALSYSAPGAIVIAPGDTRGAVPILEKCGGYCCGLDGADGPNLACEACGLPVASRIDDCSLWQAVWLALDAVCRRPVDDTDATPLSWTKPTAEGRGIPPFEPLHCTGRTTTQSVEEIVCQAEHGIRHRSIRGITSSPSLVRVAGAVRSPEMITPARPCL
ncbi:hypothetical protein ABZ467_34655 [Streptomyces sp. NPDC005727]|uniref:hypothetical protein n=1 Tax=Streptomyces sp. NPDC005727 TaxID=3157053 RepID=UPI0033BFD792